MTDDGVEDDEEGELVVVVSSCRQATRERVERRVSGGVLHAKPRAAPDHRPHCVRRPALHADVQERLAGGVRLVDTEATPRVVEGGEQGVEHAGGAARPDGHVQRGVARCVRQGRVEGREGIDDVGACGARRRVQRCVSALVGGVHQLPAVCLHDGCDERGGGVRRRVRAGPRRQVQRRLTARVAGLEARARQQQVDGGRVSVARRQVQRRLARRVRPVDVDVGEELAQDGEAGVACRHVVERVAVLVDGRRVDADGEQAAQLGDVAERRGHVQRRAGEAREAGGRAHAALRRAVRPHQRQQQRLAVTRHRLVPHRLAAPVQRLQVGAPLRQQRNHVEVRAPSGEHHSRVSAIVRQVDVGAAAEQQGDGVCVPVRGGVVQRGAAGRDARVDVDAAAEQHVGDGGVAESGRQHDGRHEAQLAAVCGLRASLEQHLEQRSEAVAHGPVERRGALVVLHVGVGTQTQEGARRRHVVAARRPQQRRVVLVVGRVGTHLRATQVSAYLNSTDWRGREGEKERGGGGGGRGGGRRELRERGERPVVTLSCTSRSTSGVFPLSAARWMAARCRGRCPSSSVSTVLPRKASRAVRSHSAATRLSRTSTRRSRRSASRCRLVLVVCTPRTVTRYAAISSDTSPCSTHQRDTRPLPCSSDACSTLAPELSSHRSGSVNERPAWTICACARHTPSTSS